MGPGGAASWEAAQSRRDAILGAGALGARRVGAGDLGAVGGGGRGDGVRTVMCRHRQPSH